MRALSLVVVVAVVDVLAVLVLVLHRLVLVEVSHVTLPATPSGDIAARRRDWEASMGGGANLPQLLDRAGLSEQGLQSWLRDDIRIQLYLAQRFGGVPEGERPAEIGRWLATLREHAGLSKGSS